jgi:hypothetical protein
MRPPNQRSVAQRRRSRPAGPFLAGCRNRLGSNVSATNRLSSSDRGNAFKGAARISIKCGPPKSSAQERASLSYMLAPLMRTYMSLDPGDKTIMPMVMPHVMCYAPNVTDPTSAAFRRPL